MGPPSVAGNCLVVLLLAAAGAPAHARGREPATHSARALLAPAPAAAGAPPGAAPRSPKSVFCATADRRAAAEAPLRFAFKDIAFGDEWGLDNMPLWGASAKERAARQLDIITGRIKGFSDVSQKVWGAALGGAARAGAQQALEAQSKFASAGVPPGDPAVLDTGVVVGAVTLVCDTKSASRAMYIPFLAIMPGGAGGGGGGGSASGSSGSGGGGGGGSSASGSNGGSGSDSGSSSGSGSSGSSGSVDSTGSGTSSGGGSSSTSSGGSNSGSKAAAPTPSDKGAKVPQDIYCASPSARSAAEAPVRAQYRDVVFGDAWGPSNAALWGASPARAAAGQLALITNRVKDFPEVSRAVWRAVLVPSGDASLDRLTQQANDASAGTMTSPVTLASGLVVGAVALPCEGRARDKQQFVPFFAVAPNGGAAPAGPYQKVARTPKDIACATSTGRASVEEGLRGKYANVVVGDEWGPSNIDLWGATGADRAKRQLDIITGRVGQLSQESQGVWNPVLQPSDPILANLQSQADAASSAASSASAPGAPTSFSTGLLAGTAVLPCDAPGARDARMYLPYLAIDMPTWTKKQGLKLGIPPQSVPCASASGRTAAEATIRSRWANVAFGDAWGPSNIDLWGASSEDQANKQLELLASRVLDYSPVSQRIWQSALQQNKLRALTYMQAQARGAASGTAPDPPQFSGGLIGGAVELPCDQQGAQDSKMLIPYFALDASAVAAAQAAGGERR